MSAMTFHRGIITEGFELFCCPILLDIFAKFFLFLLAGHLKLSLWLKSPYCVQSPLNLKFCLPLLSFNGG